MNKDERLKYQRQLLASGEFIGIENINKSEADHIRSGRVIKSFTSGLTAIVHHIEQDGQHYNLKVKRDVALVKNEDGAMSFLNEILCRQKFEQLKKTNDILNRGIVETLYANYDEGIIISKWIEGSHDTTYSREQIRNLFELLFEIEKIGLFEWDLCSGNILFNGDQVFLYDFGYMYPFNMLEAINPDGMAAKLFHMVERFETRSFMGYLMKLSLDEALAKFKVEKEEACRIMNKKEVYLLNHNGADEVVEYIKSISNQWSKCLETEAGLNDLYNRERYRSYALDIEDDLRGKSCTRETLLKIETIEEMIDKQYDILLDVIHSLWFDVGQSKEELLKTYELRKEKAIKYQIK